MLKTQSSLPKPVAWEQIISLGVTPSPYYGIDKWFLDNAIDAMAVQKLKPIRYDDNKLITLWRSAFLRNMNNWLHKMCAEEIADRLSLRCFVRIHDLADPVPTTIQLHHFEADHGQQLSELMTLVAIVRVNDRSRQPVAPWVDMLDTWAAKVMQDGVTMPPPRQDRGLKE